MTKEKLEIYKCEVCGNLVQVLLAGVGELVCCGQPMKLQTIQHDTTELGEKHAPVIENRGNLRFVQVKSHPMLKEHYIQWLEVFNNDKSEVHLKYFEPETVPELEISCLKDDIKAIEFCNIHGLWGEDKND